MAAIEDEEKVLAELNHKKAEFSERKDQLSEVLEASTAEKLQQEGTRRKYLNEFPEHVELEEATTNFSNLERRLKLKRENPSLTRSEIDDIVVSLEKESIKKINEMRLQSHYGIGFFPSNFVGIQISYEEEVALRQEFKCKIRTLWRLTHPDKYVNNLTDDQKKQLTQLFNDITKINTTSEVTPYHFLLNPHMLICRLKSLETKVEEIYKNAGVDRILSDSIPEGTIEEQIAWLTNEIFILDGEIMAAQAELLSLINNETYLYMKSHLDLGTDEKLELRKKMAEQTALLIAKADQLQSALTELFNDKNSEII
jgi:hypothetical protein